MHQERKRHNALSGAKDFRVGSTQFVVTFSFNYTKTKICDLVNRHQWDSNMLSVQAPNDPTGPCFLIDIVWVMFKFTIGLIPTSIGLNERAQSLCRPLGAVATIFVGSLTL